MGPVMSLCVRGPPKVSASAPTPKALPSVATFPAGEEEEVVAAVSQLSAPSSSSPRPLVVLVAAKRAQE